MTEMRHALTHSDPSACGGECWPSEALDLAAIDRLLAVEHREDDQPCSCDECMEYGAEDAGADWYRMPAANRIAIRILDGADTRLAVLAAAFRDHDAAVDELPVHTIVGPDVGPDLTTPERCPSGIHWVTGPYAEPPCSCAAAPLPSDTPADGLDARLRDDEWLGDTLHHLAHPGHEWSGCAYPDLWYDKAADFRAALALTQEPRSGADR